MLHPVPPSPEVLAGLYLRYLREGAKLGVTFAQFLEVIGYGNHARDVEGLDDTRGAAMLTEGTIQKIEIPRVPIVGELRVMVLLVDFPDKVGHVSPSHFHDLLFSAGIHPTGSMRDFYAEISHGRVNVTGSVHGWLRLPQRSSFYANAESGMKWGSYPRNAQRMAEDAVQAALREGIPFDQHLDKLGQGIVTALFIVHAGRGAEELHESIAGSEIWSHKWALRAPIKVGPDLFASIYLTVPEDCKVGVCAHELGHLAFQWQDFYDADGKGKNGIIWSGSGSWDLMAGGSWNGGGSRPAHPAALHKVQHQWVEVHRIDEGSGEAVEVLLAPHEAGQTSILRIDSRHYKPGQYLLLENRRRAGFDNALPGEGLLVWRVDESGEQESPHGSGLLLVQADGRRDLERNLKSDAGDPFPGSTGKVSLDDTGSVSTSFPGAMASGIRLRDIHVRLDGSVTLTVMFK